MKTVSNNDIIDQVMDYYKKGAKPALHLGMGDFSNYYGLKMGACTDITGYPYSGKTLLLKEIIINSYLKHQVKHMLFMPDEGATIEIITNLIHKISGKSFNKKYPNRIDENMVYRLTAQITNDFGVVESQQRLSPLELWTKGIENGYNHIAIDSWNYLLHNEGGSPTKYLAGILSERNMLAERHQVHFSTIIHPRNPTGSDYDKNGILKAPQAYNLMGGSEWNNNGKSIIVVHKEDKESNEYQIYIRKIKPRIVGKTGTCVMYYDIPSQRFYEVDNGKRSFFYESEYQDPRKQLNINTQKPPF